MSFNLLNKTLVIGIIFLLIGIAIQPVIIADVSIESDNSELVEITVEICEVDKTYNHTVMLTQQQVVELENLIKNFKIELDAADSIDEAEVIFKNTVVSLNKLGLIPEEMSVDYAQGLVTGKKQNLRFFKAFKGWYNRKKVTLGENENRFCLISGDTINTIFAGSVPILILFRCLLIVFRNNMFFRWLSRFPKFWDWLSTNYGVLLDKFFSSRIGFWLLLVAGINFLPIKFGALMHYGWFRINDWGGIESIPAEGWVNTIGSSRDKSWSGSFNGYIIGFTGIKIIRSFLDFFYLGAALKVHIECE